MAEDNVDRRQPFLLVTLTCSGVAGCAALIIGTLIAPFFVPDYNWISDTISDLAAGNSEILMDAALYCFAGGLFATSLAAAHAHPGGSGWSLGVLSLAGLAGIVITIGARNEYGDGDKAGIVIHSYLVYGLGFLFTVAAFAMAPGLRSMEPRLFRIMIVLGFVWVATAPLFFFLPTGWDGLYERGLGLLACAIVVILSIAFGRQAARLRKG